MGRFGFDNDADESKNPFGLMGDPHNAEIAQERRPGGRYIHDSSLPGLSGFAASVASISGSSAPWMSPLASQTASTSTASFGNSPAVSLWQQTDSNTNTETTTTTPQSPAAGSSLPSRTSHSVRLSTISPDEKVVYSLTGKPGKYSIVQKHLLPEQDEAVSVVLPPFVQESLRIDPPLELICIEGDGYDTTFQTQDQAPPPSPRLLLYSSKAIFGCQIVFRNPDNPSGPATTPDPAAGKPVGQCTSLLDTLLLEDTSHKIVRIRPAPQRFRGHAFYAPAGSFAVLLSGNHATTNRLVTVNAQGKYRTAGEIIVEQLADQYNSITDFDFGKSQGPLALLSSLTVYCLHASGDVGCLTPVIWDGAIVPKMYYHDALQTLKAHLSTLQRGTPLRRQVLAAQRYLVEIFQGSAATGSSIAAKSPATSRNHFYQALPSATEASLWPVLYQTTVLLASSQVDYTEGMPSDGSGDAIAAMGACTLDCVAAGDWAGLVVGRPQGWVEWGLTNPRVILPLFFMNNNFQDCLRIGDMVCEAAQWIERVHLSLPPSATGAMNLIPDPISESLLHVVVPRGVFTISSNAFFVAGKQLEQAVDKEHVEVPHKRTTAWAMLQTTPSDSVNGVTVWSLPQLGHGMSVRLAMSGTVANLHVTHHQYLHEMQDFFNLTQPAPQTASLQSIRELQETPPFYETIKPLVEKIHAGLGKMSQIYGSETPSKDIAADHMAIAIEIKKQCEEEIYMPLLELIELTRRRKKALQAMMETQRNDLDDLQKEKAALQAGRDRMLERLDATAANMRILADRSAHAREAVTTTGPTMTLAESDFCVNMARLKAALSNLQPKAGALAEKADAAAKAISDTSVDGVETVTEDHWQQVATLKQYMKNALDSSRQRLHEASDKLQKLAAAKGVDGASKGN